MSNEVVNEILSESGYSPTDTERQVLSAYIRYIQADFADNTVKNRKSAIKNYLRYLDTRSNGLLDDSDTIALRDYKTYMLQTEGYAPRTVRTQMYAISTLYGDCVDRGIIDSNPVEDLNIERLEKTQKEENDTVEYLRRDGDTDEVAAVLDAASRRSLRDYLLTRLMIETGVRVSELVNIKLNDIDQEERSIRIVDAKTSKYERDEERTVYYKKQTQTIMDRYLRHRSSRYLSAADSEYLLVGKRTDQLNEFRVNQIIKEIADNAGVQDIVYTDHSGRDRRRVTAHTLRKTYAVHCVKQGMPISLLSEILGHSDVETTQSKYLVYRDDDIKEAADEYRAY